MLDIFGENLLKYPGLYRCPDNIKNFKIRIKIKKILDNSSKGAEKWIETKFVWQEKRFSKYHKEFYSEEKNCVTDLEKEYHKKLSQMDNLEDEFVYSYTHQDNYTANNSVVTNSNDTTPTYLHKTMLDILENNKNNSQDNKITKEDEYFDFQSDVIKSFENPVMAEDLENMVIAVDLGEYIQNSWIKNEQPLCKISYNKYTKCLKITPDFTKTEPYVLRVAKSDEELKYCYFLENCSKEMPEGIMMNEKNLIKKLNSLRVSFKIPSLPPFEIPPKNKLTVFLFFEISSGRNFENSDVYVQYFIDLQPNWSCQNRAIMTGRTQVCSGAGKNDNLVHFGHLFDVVLEYDIQNMQKNDLPRPPGIYFEVISKDSWNRHRTEGLAYEMLPIFKSDDFEYTLNCFRFPKNFFGELRRSFIGDYRNFDDLSWIGIPPQHKNLVLNKFGTHTISTGQLKIKINTLHQSQAFLDKFGITNGHNKKDRLIIEKLRSSSLIKNVDEVLQAFKKARRGMLEAKIANVY